MKAVIQAGGKGVRLQPYTFLLPKPLMPVGDLPVIEILLKWLRRWGVRKTYITIGYLGSLIRSLCGNGSQWDLEITYSQEPEPLGTIGPLRLIKEQLTETFFTLNGDLITDLNLHDLKQFHRKHKGLITVAVTDKTIKADLGVLESQNGQMTGFREKPAIKFQASTGIYCMEPEIVDLIPDGVPFGFDDLMYAMLDQKLPVYLYTHEGLWLDIGREEDFRAAQNGFLRDYKHLVLGC
jgi:NDP-sugar pyrophosphorylase family protein